MEALVINDFDGYYGFLSNFYPCKVEYNGIEYSHTEGAFQAQKTFDENARKYIAILTPGQAKRACGRRGLGNFKIELREDWEQVKDNIMFEVCLNKFKNNIELKEKLLSIGNAVLIEGNYWHDNYWGNCYCEKCKQIYGRNQLGKTLMKVRDILREETEIM